VLLNLERQTVLVAGCAVLLFLWHHGRLQVSLLRALITAVVFFDLASAHMPYHHALEPAQITRGVRILTAPPSEPQRFFYYPSGSALHPSSYTIVRDRQPSFAEFNALLFSNLVPNAGIFWGFDYMQEMNALRRWPYLSFLELANRLPPENLYRLLGVLNVQYVVSFKPLPGGPVSLVRHFPEYPSWLYKVDSAIPRAYVVPKTSWEEDPFKTIGKLSTNGFDPRREVLLQKAVRLEPPRDFEAKVAIVDYENHRVKIQTSLNSPGVLVLADSFYPGWRAFVDGRPTEILRANLFFRGVLLEPGDHRVEFRYQPRSFIVGMSISVMTVGILIAIYLRKRWQHHPRAGRPSSTEDA
jgi:hypothetical protein